MRTEQPNKPKKSIALIVVIGVLVMLCGGAGVIGVLVSIAVPNYISMAVRAKRAEVPHNLGLIKVAQLQYESQYNAFVACQAYPAPITKAIRRWEPSAAGGFEVINWRPDGDVRGSYSVKVTAGGRDFLATGVSDVDGDGVYATYVATKSTNPSLVTDNDVY